MPQSESNFIPGLELCRAFYTEAVEPILRNDFPQILCSAALLGNGSEVLGFDSEMSSDHDWGPRVMLFVSAPDLNKYALAIKQTLIAKLPKHFRGYATEYATTTSPIDHRVTVDSIAGFFDQYMGFNIENEVRPADWLTIPEQKLLAITAGQVFEDKIGLQNILDKFAYYPHDVWLYLLASGWTRIEQEEHLMGRAGIAGDELGSGIIAARLVNDIMRLCFLMEKRYAPYPKWFGTAFKNLRVGPDLYSVLKKVMSAEKWQERETNLSKAYERLAKMHNQLAITEPLTQAVSQFHERPFSVISMGLFSKTIMTKITNAEIKAIAQHPLIGSIDQFSDNTDMKTNANWRPVLCRLFTTESVVS